MPEVTHDIMVRQVVDCKLSHESKAWFCSNLHLQIYACGANRTTWRSMVMMVGTMMLPFPSASYFSFFFFCLDSSFLFSCSLKSCSETVPCPRHTLHWSYFGLYYISIYIYIYVYVYGNVLHLHFLEWNLSGHSEFSFGIAVLLKHFVQMCVSSNHSFKVQFLGILLAIMWRQLGQWF